MKQFIAKSIALVAIALIALAGGVGTAAAAQPAPSYPLPLCSVATQPQVIGAGDTVTITGSGGTPGGTITFRITFPNGTVVQLVGNVGAGGQATVVWTAPNQAGTYSVAAVCSDTASSPPTNVVLIVSEIPRTGSDPWAALRIAGVLVALGVGLFLVVKVRRQKPAAV